MSGLTIDQSKNKGDVFREINLRYKTDCDYNTLKPSSYLDNSTYISTGLQIV